MEKVHFIEKMENKFLGYGYKEFIKENNFDINIYKF